MSNINITKKGFKCLRCGYEWIPRKHSKKIGEAPKLCPKCRTYLWNKPKRSDKDKAISNRDVKKIAKINPRRQIIHEELKETREAEVTNNKTKTKKRKS